ncbi:MAG: YdcF family protein [Bacteroidetes bacterium]|nr:YdcF family protein [Bacteroidota bacterium]MBK8143547.1 YdcF family protein [Bacteroidota bacterium]MBP6314041.1 YdcF family protein [Chitinophagaceae bacterium]
MQAATTSFSRKQLLVTTIFLVGAHILLSSFTISRFHKRAHSLFQKVITNKEVYDAAIVTGMPVDNGKLNRTVTERVQWAVYLYKSGIAKNLILSGGAVYTDYYESVVMASYAVQLGVDPQHIFLENLAEHSTENVYYSYKIAKQNGFKKLALATDPYQSMMLKKHTKNRYATHIQHIPIIYKYIAGMMPQQAQLDIRNSRKNDFVSIKSRKNIFQRIKGTLGKDVPYGIDGKLGKL